jgi:hypothetical protein
LIFLPAATGPTGGDDLECREYHLSAAWMKGGQDPHCGHIGAFSVTCLDPPQ